MALAMALLMTMGCRGEVDDPDGLISTPTDEFVMVDVDEKTYVVGHGVVLEIPGGWVDYEPESVSFDGSSWEWAVGQPAKTYPFPAGLQFSMAVPGHGGRVDYGLDVLAEMLAGLQPGYKLLDQGDVDVPGAEAAKFLRFTSDLDYEGVTSTAEQVTLMIKVDDDTSSTIRFIAPEGQWDEMMTGVYDSVEVTPR